MELRNCNKAEIYDESGNVLCAAEVTRASYDGYRLVVPPEFEIGEKPELFKVVFFDGVAGLVHTFCLLSDPLKISKDKQSLLCIVREEKGNEQRRQDLKVTAEVSIEVSCIRIPSGTERPPQRIPAKTRNISAGGVYFACGYQLANETHVQFQMHEASKPLQLTAVVLRSEVLEPEKKGGAPMFGHGCKFLDMKPQTEAELRSFIFKKERELRQRSRR